MKVKPQMRFQLYVWGHLISGDAETNQEHSTLSGEILLNIHFEICTLLCCQLD